MRRLVLAILIVGTIGIGQSIQIQADDSTIQLNKATRNKCYRILREAVRSDEFWPSMHAAEALTLGGKGEEVRKLLEPKLKTEKDDQHRCGLARELVRAGDITKASIMFDILAGDDPHGHVHACESLYKVYKLNTADEKQLFLKAMRQTENDSMSLMAAAALGRSGNPEAMMLLRKQIDNEDIAVARIVAWVLARIGSDEDIPRLKVRAKNIKDPLIHAYFINALATLGDPDSLKALIRNLSDDDPAIRTYSATFAGDARATSAKNALIKLLDDKNIDVRVRAAQSLLVLSKRKTAGTL